VPTSKFNLNWKNYFFWTILILLVLLGALFFSLTIFSIPDFNLEVYRYLKLRRFTWLIIKSLPIFWIISLLLILSLGFLTFRKTKKGYRYQTFLILSTIGFIVFSLGLLVHFLKFNRSLDTDFSRKIPHYNQFSPPREMRWVSPEEGLLAGKIISVQPEELVIVSFKGEDWVIRYQQETSLDQGVKLEKEESIKAIGEKIGDFIFQAQRIQTIKQQKMRHPFPKSGPR
jgi:amino acid transporter